MTPGIGAQLRHLLELLDSAVGEAYAKEGLPYRPRYTPVIRALMACEPSTIGEIAKAARITQPAATQTVALMIKEGLLSAEPGPEDARQRLIRITEAGRAMLPRVEACWQATAAAWVDLDAQSPAPLSQVLAAVITALEAKPFGDRLTEARARISIGRAHPRPAPDARVPSE